MPENENARGNDPGAFDPQAIIQKMRKDYWEAVEKAPEPEPEDLATLLVFRVGSERFAFRVEEVREITRVPPIIARVPRSEEVLLGVMNLRGQIIPVVDLRPLLGTARGEHGPTFRIVVLRGLEGDIGILAEGVTGLVILSASEWMPPLSVETELPQGFVKAQARDAGGVLAILDRSAFLTPDSLGRGTG